jgi:hypothetical protein
MRDFVPPPKTLARSKGVYREWIEACKEGPVAAASFEFEAAVAATILLGNVAVRTQKRLVWDASGQKVANIPETNRYIDFEYRDPFKDMV